MLRKRNDSMKKAQGSLEYLLLIGGAVLIAVIVVTFLLSASESASKNVKSTFDISTGLIQGTIICNGQAELEVTNILSDGVSIVNLNIENNGVIRHIILNQISPISHFNETYSIYINGTGPQGTAIDVIENTEPLIINLNENVTAPNFNIKLESTGLEVEFRSTIIICDS
ncbi:MAG: class III signal peptide-containing protein [archaeon]|nr:class III signal peptide-containing protein [archaeon]